MKGSLVLLWLGIVLVFGCAEKPRGDLARARAHFNEGRYREAIVFWERDLERHPENYESQAFIAYAYEKLGETDKAIEAYRKTLALNPTNAMAFSGLGRILAAQLRWNEAWEHLSKARGIEANDTLIELYPPFHAAYEERAFEPPPVEMIPCDGGERTVTVRVLVVPGSLKERERISISAAAPWARDPLDVLFINAIAATKEDRISRCYARFFARGLPAALDARYMLEIATDGRVVVPEREGKEPADIRSCVGEEILSLRFMAPPVSRSDTK